MGNLYSTFSEDAKQFKELTGDNSDQQRTPVPARNSTSNNEDNNAQAKPKVVVPFIDPRSPTQGVTRTPLEIQERNRRLEKARITNLFNKENNLTVPTTDDEVRTPTSALPPTKDGLAAFDPRSPNPEISRTPIALENAPVGRRMFQNQN